MAWRYPSIWITVQLNGAGFVTHAAEGDEVRTGDVLITLSLIHI